MSRRYIGRLYKNILRKLPRNLVAFDGHCLMCQARVQYVLERNFSYFSFFRFTEGVDPVRLEANKMCFCSFDSVEWRELRRHFPHLLQDAEGLVLIEKVPSKTASFLNLVRRRKRQKQKRGGASIHDSTNKYNPLAAAEEDLDILVSVEYEAVCRIGMKLDRWLPRSFFYCIYYMIPQWVGSRWWNYMLGRRRLWGTSEEDAVRYPKRVLGLKERTWKLP